VISGFFYAFDLPAIRLIFRRHNWQGSNYAISIMHVSVPN